MALTTNYKSVLDLDFNVHAEKSEQILDRINKSILDTEKMLDRYAKSINSTYEKQLQLINRINEGTIKEREAVLKIKAAEEKRLATEKSRIKVKEKENILQQEINSKAQMEDHWLRTRKELAKYNAELKSTDHSMGSVFSRALATVPAFYAAYSLLDMIKSGLQAVVNEAILYDSTMRTLSAVTGESLDVTAKLSKEVLELGNVYGGNLNDLAKTSQELARAGIATNELANATKVATQLALITGDSIQTATNAIVSYSQVYAKANGKMIYSTQDLGDKLAYMANASRLSVQDIGTLSNYALASSKSIGLTIDQVNGLAIAFANAGNNASTIGTQIRRFSSTLSSNSSAVKEFYKAIDVNRSELISNLGKSKNGTVEGIQESNKAFEEFVMKVKSLSENEFRNAIYGMNVLDTQFFTQLRNNSDEVVMHMKNSFSDLNGELDKTAVIADSISKRWEKMKNRALTFAESDLKEVTTVGTGLVEELQLGLGSTFELLTTDISKNARKYTADVNTIIAFTNKLRDLQEKDNKTDSDRALMDEYAAYVKKYELLKKINKLKIDDKQVSAELNNQAVINEVILERQQKIVEAVNKGFSLNSIEVEKIKRKYAGVITLLNTGYKKHQESLKQEQAKKDIVNIIADIKKNKELKADDDIIQSLNRQAYLKAVSAGLSKEEIQSLGIVVDELTKVEAKHINIKSIQKDQLRDLETYSKLVRDSSVSTDDPMFQAFETQMSDLINMQSTSLTKYKNDLVRLVNDANKLDLKIADPKGAIDLSKEVEELVKANKYTEANKKSIEATTKLYQIRTDLLTEEKRLEEEGVSKEDERYSKLLAIQEAVEGWLRGQADLNKELLITDETYTKVNKNASNVTAEVNRTAQAIINASNNTIAFSNRMNQLAVQTQMLALKWEAFKGNLKSTDLGQIKVNLDIDSTKKDIDAYRNEITKLGSRMLSGDSSPELLKQIDDYKYKIEQKQLELGNLELKNEELIRAKKEQTLLTDTQIKNVQLQITAVGKDKITQAKLAVEQAKEEYNTILKINKDKGANKDTLAIKQKELALKQAEASLADALVKSNSKATSTTKSNNTYQADLTKELEKQKALIKDINNIKNGEQQLSLKEALNQWEASKNIVKEYEKFKDTNRLKYEKSVTAELKAQKKYLELAKKEAEKYANSFESMFNSFFDGNFADGIKNIFKSIGDDMMKPMLNDMSSYMSKLTSGITNSFSGWASSSFGNIGGSIVSGLGGLALGGLGSLFGGLIGGLFSSEETPPELESMHLTSESMAKSLDFIKEAQHPLLSYTKKQTEYLETISRSFGRIGNNLLNSGLDLGGNFYQGKSKGNFFRTKTYELYGTDVKFDDASFMQYMTGDIQAAYDEIIKKTYDSWFKHKVSYSTHTTDISDLLSQDLAQATKSMFDSLNASGDLLGLDTSGLVNETISLGKMDTTGKDGTEIAQMIEDRYAAEMDRIVQDMFGNELYDFQKAGEGLAETLSRVSTTFEQVSYSLDMIGQSASWQNTNYLADYSGGLTEFNSTFDAYIDAFYSDAEKWDMKQKELTDSFAALGVALPETKDDYRNLIESFSITDEASAKTYAELLKLAPAFDELNESMEDLGVSVSEAMKSIYDAYMGDLSYFTTQQKLDFAEKSYSLGFDSETSTQNYEDYLSLLKQNSTRDEYIGAFNEYIAMQSDEVEDASNRDLLNELIAIRDELDDLKTATQDSIRMS